MAAAANSSLLFDNVNKLLSTFIPAHNQHDCNQLYASIGVKSHGTITFPDNKSNRAEFIRVPPEASVTHVKDLLNRLWCNGRPSLVISVTGGAKEYNMKPKLLRAFRRGLLKVARTTGAWIITGGMNTGIMKLVGEIVQINPDRSRPIHLIGIATWGCVSGFQQLDVHGANVHYAKPRSEQKGEAPLEPNHTEYIFVDDGSERKYGREISFRAKLEQAISGGFFASKPTASHLNNQSTSASTTPSLRPEQSDPVPVVLLVVEGGPNTVRTVHEAVVQNNIPAVFLEGTGRCCDLFAKAYHLYNENLTKLDISDETAANMDPNVLLKRYDELKNKLREELKEEIRAISGASDTSATATTKTPRKSEATTANKPNGPVDKIDYFELVYECIHTRKNFLNIISLNSRNPVEPDIDLVILQALLNATSSSGQTKTNMQRKREQLRLALEWNRVDIAKNFIMKNDRDWEIDLNDLFTLALNNDQIAFVKLFLDHDFSLTDLFRNHDKFITLYTNDQNETDNFRNNYNDPLRTIYKKIIQPLIGDFFDVDAVFPSADTTAAHEMIKNNEDKACFCCNPRRYHKTEVNDPNGSIHSEGTTGYSAGNIDIDKELFLWSVIKGRRDFALLFWSRCKNKICAALVATLIYRKRARKENDQSYNLSADEFENLAVQILDKFYQSSYHACTKAIIRQIPAYGNVTWLELAVAAEAKQFIAQRAVQDVLNDIWYGYIDQRVPDRKIVFSTIMLWYSGLLPYQSELVKTDPESLFIENTINKSRLLQTCEQKRYIDRKTDTVHMRLLTGLSNGDNIPVEFVKIGCWEKTKAGVVKYFTNVATFMSAPFVKYIYNLYFHVFFLLLFSYVILCDFFPLYDFPVDKCAPSSDPPNYNDNVNNNKNHQSDQDHSNTNKPGPYGLQRHTRPATTELILAAWVFTLLCEEIRQLFSTEAQSKRNAISAYFKNFWNKLDVLAIILFFTAFTLRFIPIAECFCAARIILSLDLTIWFMRSLDIFAAVKRLGPKLVMIGEMVHDLKFFMLMLIVFILAFGVSSYSLIYGVRPFTWHLPREIVNLAYWQIFGELNALEKFEHDYKANGYAVFILLVAYMAVVSILLINLLIAMFSNTFDRLQTDTDRIWKFQRYSLVCEYLSRPSLPPPFIFISHLWRFILYTSARCCRCRPIQARYAQHSSGTKYKTLLNEKYTSIIEIAEDALGDEVYYTHLKLGRKLVDETDLDEERVQTPQENMFNKMRTLENRIQTMSNQQAHMFEYLECLMEGLKMMGGDRIKTPETRRFDPEESFDESSGTGDRSKQIFRRESTFDEHHRHSISSPDESQSSMINFFPSRKNVTNMP
ncbi:unnamed protein product [Adineta steineri]|uniref:Uncharacterized protein n=1 Tax=Adineta steineri TaxID=433720 RepID=A0A819DWU0_9BILA|nr:unnamed protein product [Adineta steineri]